MRGMKASKRFFFEKKKQKTFAKWAPGVSPALAKDQKFFCFFFFKKRSASLLTWLGA
jgi:hypothetical protein